MDLSVPYTFYPAALPVWLAWVHFLAALFGGIGIGFLLGRIRGPLVGLLTAIPSFVVLLIASVFVSMIVTFFIHDI